MGKSNSNQYITLEANQTHNNRAPNPKAYAYTGRMRDILIYSDPQQPKWNRFLC